MQRKSKFFYSIFLIIVIVSLISFYYFFGERFLLKISGNDLIVIRQNNELIDKVENMTCTDDVSCVNKKVLEGTVFEVLDNNSWSTLINLEQDWKVFKYQAYLEKQWPIDSQAEIEGVWHTQYWQTMDGKGAPPEWCIKQVGQQHQVVHQVYKLVNNNLDSNTGTIRERGILFDEDNNAVCQQIIEYEKFDIFGNKIFNN
ncbi:hypothetical protein C4566_03530 [Candidatus Parcubacteria bacterium]|nr:MAG: hypothetical protein C4566_03530 [Candidatus Parcubacteria bacterium]